jgi:hypothetical protein
VAPDKEDDHVQERRVPGAAIGALFCCSLMACSTIPQGYDRGENLRLPAQILRWPEQAADEPVSLPGRPPGEAWRVNRSRHDDKTEYSVWSVANRGALLNILVTRGGPGPSPEEYVRLVAEEEAKTTCLTQTSDTLDSSRVGGVARVLRLNTCTLDDLPEWPSDDHQKRVNLLLYIQGRDAHYVLMRTWRATPTDADLQQWIDFFGRVAICDTRWFNGPRCPLDETVGPSGV